jgi:hypothetical protein
MLYSFKLLFKIWVVQFYKLNAGFFLFFFILFFGIVHPPQLISYHISLIMGMLESPAFLTLVLFLWFLYNLKCIDFTLKSINSPENAMLHNLQTFRLSKQSFLFGICQSFHYLPVLIYSIVVTGFAFKENNLLLVFILIIYQVIICLLSVFIYLYKLNNLPVHAILKRLLFFSLPETNIKKSFPLYLVYYTFYNRKLALLAVKLASLFILDVILILNKNDFAMRDFILVFMVMLLLHAFFVFYYVRFIEKEISFARNLPLPLSNRYLVYVFTYGLLLLPELLFMLIEGGGLMNAHVIFIFYFTGLGQLLLFTSVLYTIRLKIKEYLKLIFVIYLLSSILLLSQYYLLFLVAEWIISFAIFLYSYYRFEIEV